jgi:hypothetical protein
MREDHRHRGLQQRLARDNMRMDDSYELPLCFTGSIES